MSHSNPAQPRSLSETRQESQNHIGPYDEYELEPFIGTSIMKVQNEESDEYFIGENNGIYSTTAEDMPSHGEYYEEIHREKSFDYPQRFLDKARSSLGYIGVRLRSTNELKSFNCRASTDSLPHLQRGSGSSSRKLAEHYKPLETSKRYELDKKKQCFIFTRAFRCIVDLVRCAIGNSPPNSPVIHSTSKKRKTRLLKICQTILIGILIIFCFIALLTVHVILDYIHDATAICRPPRAINLSSRRFAEISPKSSVSQQPPPETHRPLIEYYVHGRGNGHTSRSMAIINKLNMAGVDVRLFIGRATIWKQIHDASLHTHDNDNGEYDDGSDDFDVTSESLLAEHMAKILLFPNENIENRGESNEKKDRHLETFFNLPWENDISMDYNLTMESKHTNELHSQFLFPSGRGTTKAISVTSISPHLSYPSAISHSVERIVGDCEVSRQSLRYPNLIVTDGDIPGMMRAKFGKIPSIAISHGLTFVVARTKWKGNLKDAWKRQRTVNFLSSMFSQWHIATNFFPFEVKSDKSVITKAPLRDEILGIAQVRHQRIQRHAERLSKNETMKELKKNKLVLCYFRDKNEQIIVEKLLDFGFDVVVFNSLNSSGSHIEKRWKIERQDEQSIANFEDDKMSDEGFIIYSSTTGNSSTNHANEVAPGNMTQHQDYQQTESSGKKENQEFHYKKLLKMLNKESDMPKKIDVSNKDLFVHFMSIADGIVGSGGSQLLSESIYCRIPMLALYRKGDTEQQLNIEMLTWRRDSDLKSLHKKSKYKDKKYDPPKVFGTSHTNFIKALERRENESPDVKRETNNPELDQDKNSEMKENEDELIHAKAEFDSFVDVVTKSTVSESFYEDIFQFINDPYCKKSREIQKFEIHPEVVLKNHWMDGMPEPDEVILEILKQVL